MDALSRSLSCELRSAPSNRLRQ
uniref:Uncharacterized protein n=1 Tax=Arundo donax TaxID=35708 RepID=A0A0A8ZTY0_ARUDO